MWIFDQGLDLVRIPVFFISLYCVVTLILRYRSNGRNYNTKTKDIWYAFLMWSITGCVAMIQGLILNRPFTPGFVCVVAGILVTGRALQQKGSWGGTVD